MKNHNQFGGGGHHGGGHHGGGWGGGWGYPIYYPYPYMYPNYGSLYLDIPRQDENFIIEGGLIKKKKKKTDDDKKLSAAGDPVPRPIGPVKESPRTNNKVANFLFHSNDDGFSRGLYRIGLTAAALVGTGAGYFIAKKLKVKSWAGALAGAGILIGGFALYNKK